MRQGLSIAMLVIALIGPLTSTLAAEESRIVELATPRPPGHGEAVQLQVTTGPLPQGARLTVVTEEGEILGAVAPFGRPHDRGSTTATVPVPRSAVGDGRLRLRLEVIEPGAPPRPPRPDEVKRLDLVLVPQGE
jgi:hypothetical protein